MICSVRWVIGLLLVLASVLPAPGQPYNPFAGGNNQPQDPRARRALRERAIAYAGSDSRPFVERFGDDAVSSIFALSPACARKLVEFYGSEGFGRIPKPAELLKCISLRGHGDDVVLWLVEPEHARLISDLDNQDAFMSSPLEIIYSLKSIDQAAAEMRSRRLTKQAERTPLWQYAQMSQEDWIMSGVVVGFLLLCVISWRRRRSAHM